MNPAEPGELDTIIADYLQAAERGQAPAPASWIARHPDHAAELLVFLNDIGRFGTFLGLPNQPALEATTELTTPVAGADAMPASEGERFGEYELIRVLGQGGMGTVYEAQLAGTSLRVALKVLKPSESEGAEATQRLREEVENTAGLRHPNIVPIYHVGEHAGQPYYTMELIEGGSLHQHLPRYRGQFVKVARLLATTARAVHHAHQRRILHRDLKPGNILLDAAGEPHVADFGLATRLDDAGTATDSGPPAGSLPWMAPEAVRGEPTLSTAIDVWALGVILYELLTGVRPFAGTNAREVCEAILEREPPKPRAVNPGVPRDLDAVCRRCLHKDPDKRYESATALALELERWLRDEPVRARRAGRTERVARWCRRNPGLAVGSAVLLVFLVAGLEAALWLTRDQEQKLRVAVLQNNEFAARHVASSVLGRLEQLSEPVLAAVGDDDLRRACSQGKIADAQAVLERHFQGRSRDRLSFATVYLLDPDGKLVTLVDPNHPRQGPQAPSSRVVGVRFFNRDYFQGALRHRYERVPRDRVHLSRVYRSQNDGLDKLAISCAVLAEGPNERPWILAATITTDATLGVESLHDIRHKAVLFAPRDADPVQPGELPPPAGYVILVHPAFLTGEKSVPFPAGRPGPVPLPSEEPELRPASGPPPFPADDNSTDPVAEHGHSEFAARWLTGSARVGNTELIVLIQQRYEEAVAPYQAFIRRFLQIAGGLIGLVLLSLVGLRLIAAHRRRQAASPPTSD
jgi:serine/threonine-protein kinase